MKYFSGLTTEKEIQNHYWLLAKQHHPDVAGYEQTSTMADINVEYQDAMRVFKKQAGKDEYQVNIEMKDVEDFIFKFMTDEIFRNVCLIGMTMLLTHQLIRRLR